MDSKTQVIETAYEYVYIMSKAKQYNPQSLANIKFLDKYSKQEVINMLNKCAIDFCNKCTCDKVRDFVYKNDYFTPRKMYLISPIYYIYYTYLVFQIARIYLSGKDKLDFSRENISVFYSGTLILKDKEQKIDENVMFNKSYADFQKKRNEYLGKSVLKIDIQNFFDNIKIDKLITKLKCLLGEKKEISELECFFKQCNIDRLPQLHYSIASSILSQFYLVDFDKRMEKITIRDELQVIRFVDDMYIIHLNGISSKKENNNLLNEISYFLWKDSLSLNTMKTQILSIEDFKEQCEVVFSNYFGLNRFSTEKLFSEKVKDILSNDKLTKLIDELNSLENIDGIDLKKYKELLDDYISVNGENSTKILNNIIFSDSWKSVPDNKLKKIIENWKFILFNPNQFTILYISIYRYLERKGAINEDGSKIKELLNYLFSNKTFTFRDSLVATSYLFQNKKKNEELLEKIEEVNHDFSQYINKYL
ncbi:reverse transcriptase domain-containing protein [Clostridium sporogenes]|uniref:reverse transcriptase domain-containing protein n=1 Tax=Clostridium sporogenes TaxID=1509 RepID=UPI0022390E8F|nr:reverse transcriptase domain-containing protein [Clostridium sporogenes]MCW6088795.1 hypothetical protein [Clostridium sporogenes]